MRRVLTALVAVGVAGCVQAARLAPPPGLAAAEPMDLAGLDGRREGRFRAGADAGTFTRDETRLGVFDPLFVRRSTTATFTLEGPSFAAPLTGDCAGGQDEATVGGVTGRVTPFRYECAFSDGGALRLEAVYEGLSGQLSKEARRGSLSLEGRSFALRSLHAYAGGAFESATPVGHEIAENGRAVAALDLSDVEPRLALAPGLDPTARRAALAAAAALGLMADPAESPLDG